MMKTKLYILLLILFQLTFLQLRASTQEDPKQLYRELQEKSGLGKAMKEVDLALHYFPISLDSVIKYSKILEQYGNRFNNRSLDAYRYTIKGHIALEQLKFDSAHNYQNEAFELFRKAKDTLQMGWVMCRIGKAYFLSGNYRSSSDKYMQALNYFENLNNKEGIAFALNGMGNGCIYTEKFDLALEYYESSLKAYEELGNSSKMIMLYNNLASVQYSNEEYSKALEYFRLAAEGFEKIKDYKSLSVILSNISLCYTYLKEYGKAEEYIRKSLDYAIQENDVANIINSKLNYGALMSYEGNYKEAARFNQEALDLAIKYDLPHYKESIYNDFAGMHALAGDYKQAYNYHLKYDSLHSETLSKETHQRIEQLNLTYKTQLKEKEINQLKAEKATQKK